MSLTEQKSSVVPTDSSDATQAHERELAAIIEEARRRARRRRLAYAASLIGAAGLADGLLLSFGGGGDGGTPAKDRMTPGQPARAGAHGLSVRIPVGWHLADETLTPRLVDPVERLSVGTFPMRPGGRGCAQLPARAYSDMAAGDGLITIQERGGTHNGYPPRPARFQLGSPPQLFECAPANLDSHEFVFRDSGRNFYAFVVLGPNGPVQSAEGILNSLRVERASNS